MGIEDSAEDKLDAELLALERDVQFNVKAIINGATFMDAGKYVPNSKLAKQTADKMTRISQILAIYEQDE